MIEIVDFAPPLQPQVLALILSIQRDEYGLEITAQDQPDLLDVPGFYQAGAGGFWVACDGAEVVGTIALHDIGGGQGALRKMFVRASHRGREHGVAKRLLDTLLHSAAVHGVQDVMLGTTDRFVAAHRFYEKHGFARMPADALPPGFHRMAVDTRFYCRTVAPAPTRTLAALSLLVRDYDEAIAWYTGVLGFELQQDTPLSPVKRWVVVSPGPGAALLLARAANAEQQAQVGRQAGGRVFLFLHTSDFDADHARLQARGVRFVEPPRDEAYGRVAVFEDLYGNRWDLIEPG